MAHLLNFWRTRFRIHRYVAARNTAKKHSLFLSSIQLNLNFWIYFCLGGSDSGKFFNILLSAFSTGILHVFHLGNVQVYSITVKISSREDKIFEVKISITWSNCSSSSQVIQVVHKFCSCTKSQGIIWKVGEMFLHYSICLVMTRHARISRFFSFLLGNIQHCTWMIHSMCTVYIVLHITASYVHTSSPFPCLLHLLREREILRNTTQNVNLSEEDQNIAES